MKRELDSLTPKEIVRELDKYIVGQEKAKKAVAIALRNRMRRQMLPEELRDEVAPKNIIMIGSTGVGKTEIARRLAKLCGAPFIKVEASKYTEVGYVGRDVESMVRDLMSVGLSMVKSELAEDVRQEAEQRTEEGLLDLLLPGIKKGERSAGFTSGPSSYGPVSAGPASTGPGGPAGRDEAGGSDVIPMEPAAEGDSTREKFRRMLREGKLEDKIVEVDVAQRGFPSIEIFSGQSFEEMDVNFGGLANLFGGRKKKKRVTVREAREILLDQEMDRLVDTDRAADIARDRVEQMGIIFVDEIDKVAVKEGRGGVDVSREGVQRDILPIVEGSQVNTKYGLVDTSHILFIAAGAFHMSKPSDLIPELQGRFPLRVELDDLSSDDFFRILSEPENALTKQYIELLKTEGVEIEFSEDALKRISEIAAQVNSKTENIGARRLHTIMELLLEEVSFNAPELKGQKIPLTPKYVDERLNDIMEDQDLSRYIL
ncbi:MAG: ATP-dependent protease ATPase subunit HslU [Spirochaetota bacterium]|nr:ATP-dependent protease ATPase subunit HslU [Spirochaetota bacterium]